MVVKLGIRKEVKGRSPQGERGLKFYLKKKSWDLPGSLSARRAWIEINEAPVCPPGNQRRSPQGERGLKCLTPTPLRKRGHVALRKESVD